MIIPDLPEPSAPGAQYTPVIRDGDLIFITGQLPQWNGERRFIGKLGRDFEVSEGAKAARLSALNVIAHLKAALDGDLSRMRRCLRLGVYFNATPDFLGASQAANGASDLMHEVFGDRGRHTRLAIGVAALPYDAAAEVEATFAVA